MESTVGGYPVHPAADLFPPLMDEEFDDLVASIRDYGLDHEVMLTADGKVVDGRNRLRACIEAGVDPRFSYLDKDTTEAEIWGLVVRENIHRRHLSASQRSVIGLDLLSYHEKQGLQRKSEGGASSRKGTGKITCGQLTTSYVEKSRETTAKAVGVSASSIQRAKLVATEAPHLTDDVRRGMLSLYDAYQKAKKMKHDSPKLEPTGPGPTILLASHTGKMVPYPALSSNPTFNETKGDGISWAHWSWNPVTGCLHGCQYCYAREIANRYPSGFPIGFEPLFHHERLTAPLNTRLPNDPTPEQRRVFVCSMADLYGNWVPDDWIQQVHTAMLDAPWWEYLLLTKYPKRYVGLDLPSSAWVGTSVDEQKRVSLAQDAFSKIDNVKVKWLSLEPLREPLVFDDLSMFDWIVIGAQTGTNQPTGFVEAFSPPFEWVASIVEQARKAGCKIHMKPNLRNNPGMALLNEYPV